MDRRCPLTRAHGPHPWDSWDVGDEAAGLEWCPGRVNGPNLPGDLGRRNPPPLPGPGQSPLWRTTWRQAQDAAVLRARRTGLKQRVRFCRCGDLACGLWVVSRHATTSELPPRKQDTMPTMWV